MDDPLPARAIGRVMAGLADPADAARRLDELTHAGPARDNVTAVVIDVLVDLPVDGFVGSGPTMRDNERRVDQHVPAPSRGSTVR